MNDKTKALLERVIKLATGVSCLHGRYELGKDGYEELRGIQKEAMAILKEEKRAEGMKQNDVMTFYGIKCVPDPNIPPGAGIIIHRTTSKGVTVTTLPSPAPPTHLHFKADGSVDIAGQPAPTEELWHGYRKADVLEAAYRHLPICSARSNDIGVRLLGGDLKLAYADGFSQTATWQGGWELELRGRHGLRRPEEPDYKKLG